MSYPPRRAYLRDPFRRPPVSAADVAGADPRYCMGLNAQAGNLMATRLHSRQVTYSRHAVRLNPRITWLAQMRADVFTPYAGSLWEPKRLDPAWVMRKPTDEWVSEMNAWTAAGYTFELSGNFDVGLAYEWVVHDEGRPCFFGQVDGSKVIVDGYAMDLCNAEWRAYAIDHAKWIRDTTPVRVALTSTKPAWWLAPGEVGFTSGKPVITEREIVRPDNTRTRGLLNDPIYGPRDWAARGHAHWINGLYDAGLRVAAAIETSGLTIHEPDTAGAWDWLHQNVRDRIEFVGDAYGL